MTITEEIGARSSPAYGSRLRTCSLLAGVVETSRMMVAVASRSLTDMARVPNLSLSREIVSCFCASSLGLNGRKLPAALRRASTRAMQTSSGVLRDATQTALAITHAPAAALRSVPQPRAQAGTEPGHLQSIRVMR